MKLFFKTVIFYTILLFCMSIYCAVSNADQLVYDLVGSEMTNPEVPNGISNLDENNLNDAEKNLKKSLNDDPNSIVALLGLAELSSRKNNVNDRKKYIKKALAVDPSNPTVRVAWGRLLHDQKKYKKAEHEFKGVISKNPKFYNAYFELAKLYFKGFRKPETAVQYYHKALEINPKHVASRFGLGLAYVSVKKFDKAIVELEKAEKLNSKNYLIYQAIGRIHVLSKNYREALNSFFVVLKINPNFFPSYIDIGDIYLTQGDDSKAIAHYLKALEINPEFDLALIRVGMVHESKKRFSEAEKAYLSAIKLGSGQQGVAMNNLANIYAAQEKKLDKALQFAEKAVSIYPKVSTFLDTLGWVLKIRGDIDKAELTLLKAAEINSYDAEIFYHLGIVYELKGNKIEAINAFEKVLKINKNFNADDVHKRLAKLK